MKRHALLAIAAVALLGAGLGIVVGDWLTVGVGLLLASLALYGRAGIDDRG